MNSGRTTRTVSGLHSKQRQSHNVRHAIFTMKRPMVFQVRKSLVEYLDEELLNMNTSVFYQRIFILAKNVDPMSETVAEQAQNNAEAVSQNANTDAGSNRAAEEEDHYSEMATEEDSDELQDAGQLNKLSVTINEGSNKETVTRTFRFYGNDDVQEEAEPEEPEPEPQAPQQPKDIFTQFTDMLQELHAKCRELAYSPDPLCGLVLYMNEYTMMMLESSEDMIGIFCEALLSSISDYWQNHRVFHIEDHIKEVSGTDYLNLNRTSPLLT